MSNEAATTLAPQPCAWEQVDLYRFFAFVFAAPTRERFEWLQQPTLETALEPLWMEMGCEGKFPGLGSFADYQDYESTYLALFDVGLPQPPIPLVESGHYKSQPAQQVALENGLFHEVLGLRANRAGYPVDHLVTQLEFLSAVRYVGESSSREENRRDLARLEHDFLGRHLLNWFSAVAEKLTHEQPPVFSTLCRMLSRFLHQRHAASAARLQI